MELSNNAVWDAVLRQINPVGCGVGSRVKCPVPVFLPYCPTEPHYSHVTCPSATLWKARGQDATSLGICGKRV
jgi:hypothetical protein